MDNNIKKKAFFTEFIKWEYLPKKLSIKQLIQEKLIQAIALYQQQSLDVNYFPEISPFLAEKIILCPLDGSSKKLVYRCAIPFFMANISKLSPLYIADCLIALLNNQSKPIASQECFEVAIYVTKSGWIDFCISDRSLVIWLNQLVTEIKVNASFSPEKILVNKSKVLDKLFPLQYIYGRCFSLLNLGIAEKVINFKADKFTLKSDNLLEKLWLLNPQEKNLIRQICLMMDYLALKKTYDFKHWREFTRNLSEVWLEFVPHCQFCKNEGDRLKIIFITQYCIHEILILNFGITPQTEI